MMACSLANPGVNGQDHAKEIHVLRKSLVEAYMSILNGIKSPTDGNLDHNNPDISFAE